MWRRSKQPRWICVAAVTALLVLASLPYFPRTKAYKSQVRSLFYHQHKTIAYYLNYRDPQLAMQMGSYYFGGGAYDLKKAAGSYNVAVKLEPKVLWGHYQLARILFVEGNKTKAIEEIDAELAANPANLRSLYVRGLIEDAQGNLPAAEADFTRFVSWAPAEWGGYNDLSYVLAKEGKYIESEATINEALKHVPDAKDIPWLWNSRGLAQLNELHYSQALVSFEKALVLAKAITPAGWHRAYSGNDPATTAQSITNFQNAIQSNILMAKQGSTL